MICPLIPFLLFSCALGYKIHKRQSQPVVCGQALYTGSVSETAQAGSFVLKTTATDTAGNALTWSIPDTTLQSFSINPVTGDISISAQLARSARFRSALEFTVRASETNNPQVYCETRVRINVVTVATTAAPSTSSATVFTQPSYAFSASSCVPGTTIGQVLATSITGQTYNYFIPSTSSYFSVNPTSGLITLLQIPPASTQTFSVTANGQNGQIGTAPVTVTLNCVGINGIGNGISTGVTFGQSYYSFTQTTCGGGVPIGAVTAYSTFGGYVTYQLLGGNGVYYINPSTGQIFAQSSTPGTQTLQVQAISSSGQSATIPVTVTSLCNGVSGIPGGIGGVNPIPVIGPGITGTYGASPVFTTPYYTFTATSCYPGAIIGQVSAMAYGGTVIYQSSNPYFSVNPSTGQIMSLSGAPQGVQTLQVMALSSSGQSASTTVTINTSCTGGYNPIYGAPGISSGVPPGPAQLPTFLQNGYVFTDSSCAPGGIIGTTTAVSPYGYIIYSIDGIMKLNYAINPSTGQLTTISAPAGGLPLTFNVRATAGGYSSMVPVTITPACGGGLGLPLGQPIGTGASFGQPVGIPTIGQQPIAVPTVGQPSIGQVPIPSGTLQFAQPSYTFSLSVCTIGATVGTVSAIPQLGSSVTYFLLGSPLFAINSLSGAIITLATPPAGTTISTIIATSGAGQTATTKVSVTSSCSGGGGGGASYGTTYSQAGGPIFSQMGYQCSVSCSSQTQGVCVISASNAQQDTMNYAITPSNQFYVDPNSGEIRTITPLSTPRSYQLAATATDPYGNTASATVLVSVIC